MKRSRTKWMIALLVLVVLGVYVFSQSGYSISEAKALKKSFPNDNGAVVNEQRFKNYKIIIWKGQHETYAKLLYKKLNFLYQVRNSAVLSSIYPYETIKRTWSASLNSHHKYNTMLAVEVDDPQIVKVVITNENTDNEILDQLDEVKKISSLFIELPIKDGYAASFVELDPKDVGAFVFRGIDEKGKIKYVGR